MALLELYRIITHDPRNKYGETLDMLFACFKVFTVYLYRVCIYMYIAISAGYSTEFKNIYICEVFWEILLDAFVAEF